MSSPVFVDIFPITGEFSNHCNNNIEAVFWPRAQTVATLIKNLQERGDRLTASIYF